MNGRLTAQEAAQILGYHIHHVYRLLKSGDLRGEKFNRTWILNRREVDRFKALQDAHGRYWKGQL